MDYDKDKVDEMVLALLYLTSSRDKYATRAWIGPRWTGCIKKATSAIPTGQKRVGRADFS
ncbi:MAG: hypothetical protein Fur0044_15810 [Anaerolineae bacterium]|nr:hypothetical protein [Anaerolineae bacterium]